MAASIVLQQDVRYIRHTQTISGMAFFWNREKKKKKEEKGLEKIQRYCYSIYSAHKSEVKRREYMRMIIRGKLYDTDTAEEICINWNGLPSTDPDNCLESLYRKKTGEFFLAGYGGDTTKYGQLSDGVRIPGMGIFPISLEEAKGIVEVRCDPDNYEEIFGPVEE